MNYNVKTIAAMLGKSQTAVIQKARRLNLRNPELKGSHWYFTEEQVRLIEKELPRVSSSKIQYIAKEAGVSKFVVRNLALRLRLGVRTDYDKVLKACKLKKTKEYTLLGIRKRL
jgi:hypothetical protein